MVALPYVIGLLCALIAFFIGRKTAHPKQADTETPSSMLIVAPENADSTLKQIFPSVPKNYVNGLREAATYNDQNPAVEVLAMGPKTLTHELQMLDRARDYLVLREKIDAMGVLSAGVAHEVANPIGFVTVSTENMQADLDKFREFLFQMMGEEADEEVVETFKSKLIPLSSHLDIILDGCERIRNITRELQHFARTSPGKDRAVRVIDLVENMVGLARTRYKRRVEFKVSGDAEVKVKGQAAEINQAVLSLIFNGSQAIVRKQDAMGNRNPGTLNLVISTHEQLVELRVTDNGEGIPGEIQDKVFDAGFTTRKDGGTGMGLTLARHVAEKHGGRLSLFSTNGEGTTATMILPKAPPEPKTSA